MIFNWSDYIALSEEILKTDFESGREATFRCAISRSYYAAFCIARNYLISQGYDPPRADVHRDLRRELSRQNNNLLKGIGRNLERMFEYRKQADYDDCISGAQKKANTNGIQARRIDGIITELST